ncbi:MAG: vWA domain-containing protein [Candidatus Natronoplasma sp.]
MACRITMIELEVEETETENFEISSHTSSKLEATEGDILLAKNPINEKSVAGELKIKKGKEKDTIGMERTLFESIGLDEGFEIKVVPYRDEVKNVIEVEFGVENIGKNDRDPLTVIKENEEEFMDFVKEKICTKHTEILWKDKDLLISIEKTYPKLETDEVIDFTEVEEFTYSWGGSELKSFDGILLIDMSGSMEIEDLVIRDFDWLIERIDKSIGGTFTTEFLQNLKDNTKAKRSQGAVLCSLIYFVQKIGRGVGDKISVIPFSDRSSIIEFDGGQFFSSEVSDTESAAEKIIEEMKYYPRGQTNISAALVEAIEMIKDFEHDKMKMIVLLTDGEPHPKSLDDSDSVLNIVENRLEPRRDVIINTIGLGDQVDHHLLDEIAKKTGGDYTHVNSLQGLTEAYSRYATTISIKSTLFE